MKDVLLQAIRHFGKAHQQIKAVEELGELQQAILKGLDNPLRRDVKNIIEEVADVEIVLEQIKLIFELNSKEINAVKDKKILRLMSRMVEK